MRYKRSVRILSFLLVITLVFLQCPIALAADEQNLPFHLVETEGGTFDLRETVERDTTTRYQDTDMVRVSIVLKEESCLEQISPSADSSLQSQLSAPKVQLARNRLEKKQETLANQISSKILQGKPLDVAWNLTLTANLISADVPYGKIDEIKALPEVSEVVLECRYEPAVYEVGTADPNMSTSSKMIGSTAAYAAGYTGANTRIAIIDTGTDVNHQSFDPDAFAYAIAEADTKVSLLDENEIAQKVEQLNAYKRSGKTNFYINEKLPFGYNYVDNDLDIDHDHDTQGGHGSHVAGIAAANRYIPNVDGTYSSALDKVKTQGVAPDAQIITMKVFGKEGGAYDSDYMAAIEDAIILGCDAINLSLGSSSPGYTENQLYGDILERLSETDIVLSVSAGNSGTWADGTWNGYLYAEDSSLNMVGSPGSYTNSLTVASADNAGFTGQYLTVYDQPVFYTETFNYNAPISTLAGQELEYVLIEGIGKATNYYEIGDWEGIDLNGKIAVCSRGSTSFSEKASYAAEKGAIAVIIYNNTDGIVSMNLSDYYGEAPCVSITQADGAWMLENGTLHEETVKVTDYEGNLTTTSVKYYTGTLSVSQDIGALSYDTPYTMSVFSSWGVPGDLSLKPEITAPGGNIYSVDGTVANGQAYMNMSGTSMAAPQVAGMSALMAQYLKETKLHERVDLTMRQLSQSLLMSTAVPMTDAESGNYYPVLQQGAGLANIGNALNANSYVLVDGQPDGKVKAELGHDPERTGVYSFSFTLNNLTDCEQAYLLSADLFTQDVFESYETWDDMNNAEWSDSYDTAWFLSQKTTPLDAEISWLVDGEAIEIDSSLLHMDFDNDGDVDHDDAQAPLDYVTGVRTSISNGNWADLDSDGRVTSYDVYLFVTRLNSGSMTLPADSQVRIQVTMQLTASQKKELNESYQNGAYVEGFVFASPVTTAEGAVGVSHSIPVLGFYGNWTDSSMYEIGTYYALDSFPRSESKWPYMGWIDTNYITARDKDSATQYAWGANLASYLWEKESYLPERAALNNETGASLCQYRINPIRNAANAKMEILNAETGEIYKQRELGPIRSGFYYSETQTWYQDLSMVNLTWPGTDAYGKRLPEGTKVIVRVTLAPEYYVDPQTGETDWAALGKGATQETILTIDNTAPEITDVSVDPTSKQLTIYAKDENFVAAITMNNPDAAYSDTTVPLNQQIAGKEVSQTFSLDWYTGTRIQLTVYDYAGNAATYEIEVGDQLGNKAPRYEFSAMDYGTWISFDRDTESSFDVASHSSVLGTIQAAANADGMVFLVTTDSKLYIQDEYFQDSPCFVADLPVQVYDLAYNSSDGNLYGVSEEQLLRIDKLTGKCTKLEGFPLSTGTLACNEDGTFYSLCSTDNCLYSFTLDTLPQPVNHGVITGMEEVYDYDIWDYVTKEVVYNVNSTQQSLVWNCNDGKLYWMQYDNPEDSWFVYAKFLQINPDDWSCTMLMDFTASPVLGLFVRDLEGSNGADWYAPTKQATGLELSREALTLKVRETTQLSASVQPWTLTDRSVRWESSDRSVATVDEQGVITALSEGSCRITATSVSNESISASCAVSVEALNLTIKGTVQNKNGASHLYTWNLSGNGTIEEGPALNLTAGASAYGRETGSLYLQGTDDAYTMYQIDEKTGRTLASSGASRTMLPVWDMAYCEYLGQDSQQAVGIYGAYLGIPSRIMDNKQVFSGWDFTYYLVFVTQCDRFVGIASAGQQQLTVSELQEDGTEVDVTYEAECFYLLDAAGYIWTYCIYDAGEDMYGGMITNIYATDLIGKLPFLKNGDLQQCALVEDHETGYLVLSYFTGDTTELYLLYKPSEDSVSLSSVYLGNLGDEAWPATVYSVKATDTDVEPVARLCETERTGLPLEMSEFTEEASVPDGHLNAVVTAVPVEADEGLIRVPVRVASGSTNGIVELTYDPDVLVLENVTSMAAMSSVKQETGMVRLGFVDVDGLSDGNAAIVTFRANTEKRCTTEVQVDIIQQNEKVGTSEVPLAEYTMQYTVGKGTPSQRPGADEKDPAHEYEISDTVYEGQHTVRVTYTCADCGKSYTEEMQVSCPSAHFEDLTADWYHEILDEALYRGLVKGVSDTRFDPDGTLTRGQFVTMLYRLTGSPRTSDAAVFRDVLPNSYYAEAVAWAAAEGYVTGVAADTFAPDMQLTREMAVTILWRMSGSPTGYKLPDKFTDNAKISSYARQAMAWACENGLVQGVSDTSLAPQALATRAQGAALVLRFDHLDD